MGKSTLFNRLTRSRDALVADFPGLTRDRKYGEGKTEERDYIVIDTGGISGDEAGIDQVMAEQSLLAIEEADAVLFLVDGKAGLNPSDELIADHLRRCEKPCYLVVNKTDGIDIDVALGDFYGLGLVGLPRPIAASHGRGVSQLIEDVLAPFPAANEFPEDSEGGIRIGVVGRPNVGKSTLVNRMLGEERVVVYDKAGTTRDSIYIPYRRNDKPYTLIDTAGVRRRRSVTETVEKFSIVKTLQAIKDSHVVVLVVDAHEGLTEQDMHLLGFVIDAGRALVIAVNKWDGMSADDKAHVKHELQARLEFAKFARIHFISALHGSGVGDLYKSVEEAHKCAFTKWSTNKLTTLLEDAIEDHQPPLVHGRRIKLRYAHLGGSNPPLFIVHGNQTNALPTTYKRYLENKFIKVLKIRGTPVRFEFRTSDNPFDGKKNQLSQRQITKKQRLIKHVNKAKKKAKKK